MVVIALATHYRIAVNDNKTVVGLPEVKLSLLLGSVGTQRLPKLVSTPDALDMSLMVQLEIPVNSSDFSPDLKIPGYFRNH